MSVLPVLLLVLQAVIHVHTQLVVVPAVVTGANGRLVSSLTRDNFRVSADGRPVTVVAFHGGDTSMTLGLIVDRSQSMRPKAKALFDVVARLLLLARPDDELFAVDFNDTVSLALPEGQPFTHIGGGIMRAIAAIPAQGQTALYDGVAVGLKHLQLGRAERHALVVISDGGDNVSRRKYSEILALAERSDAVIYAIGLLGDSLAEEQEDAGLLKRLCKDTGGVAYFPKTAEEISSVATQIARDLHEQYTLGFSPAEPAGKPRLHVIKVTATDASGAKLRVRARTAYLTE